MRDGKGALKQGSRFSLGFDNFVGRENSMLPLTAGNFTAHSSMGPNSIQISAAQDFVAHIMFSHIRSCCAVNS